MIIQMVLLEIKLKVLMKMKMEEYGLELTKEALILTETLGFLILLLIYIGVG